MPVSDEDFETVMAGLRSVKAIKEGSTDPAGFRVHVPATVNVRALRKRLRLTRPPSPPA